MPTHTASSYIGDSTSVLVVFDHQPAEKPITYPSGAVRPGCDADVIITAVLLGGDDVLRDLSQDCLGRIEGDCWDFVSDKKGE